MLDEAKRDLNAEIANQAAAYNQQLIAAEEPTNVASAAATAHDKDHHRKVRINKDAIKKRAQSAKTKKKIDPTRDNFKGPTRWLPDSAFTTYFGKPAFHAYGMANTNPVVGGNVYGQYMLSHNVNPESGNNLPQYQQVYHTALQQGLKKNNGIRQPELPRKSTIHASKPGEVQVKTAADSQQVDVAERNPIMPDDGPRTVKAKLGASKVQTVKILRPTTSKRIAATRQFDKPNFAATVSSSVERSKSPTAKALPVQQQASFPDDGIQTIKPTPVTYQQAPQQQQPVYSHVDFAIDENQDIGEADGVAEHQQENIDNSNIPVGEGGNNAQTGGYYPLCQVPTSRKADVKELDPRTYQFAPSCWIERIRPAGRTTYRSERLYNVLT